MSTILAQGPVGTNTNTPVTALDVSSTNDTDAAPLFQFTHSLKNQLACAIHHR
ncbi:MAG: hypothetical protein AAGA77_07465 [Bacteroidota bacterium]